MGADLSKERKDELDAEHERNLREDQQNEERNRLDQIRKIMKKRQAEFEEGMKKKESDLSDEAEKNLDLINEALEDLEDLKVQNQRKLENWKSNFDEQGKQKKQELREEGDREIEKRQNDLKNDLEKLEKLQRELNEKRGHLLKSLEEQNEFKEKLQKEHDEITAKSVKEHQERLSKGKNELFDFQKTGKEEMRKLQEKQQEKQLQMMNEKKEQSAYQLNANLQMMAAIKGDEQNVDFKSECDNIRILYNRFKKSYGNDEKAIRRMIFEMEQSEKLKNQPQINDTLAAFGKFCNKAESVYQKLPKEYQNLAETFKTIKSQKPEIEDGMEKIQNSIKIYKKARKEGTPLVDIQIKRQFENLRKLVNDLDGVILKFNIDPSNQLLAVLDKTMEESSRNVLQRIEKGSEKGSGSQAAINN